MKFKPIYLYGVLFVLAAVVLIIVSQQSNEPGINPTEFNSEGELPDDEIHNPFKSEGSNAPSKDNVSQSYREKLAELKKAVEENPDDTLAIKNYADFLTAAHQFDEAIMNYKKILNVDPGRIDINFSLSIIYYNMGELAKAEELNNNVLKADPENLMALYNLGAIAATQGNKERAKEFWNKIVQKDPDSDTGKLAKKSLEML